MLDSASFPRLYWNVALTAFFALALLESYVPRRQHLQPLGRRWLHNVVLAIVNMAVGLAFRASPLLVAGAATDWAPLSLAGSPLPFWLQCVVGFLFLDAVRYAQHRLMHGVPALWRLHQVHHSDQDFDLTTGLRFHPLEAVVTQGSYLAVLALVAPPIEVVLVSELATIVQNFFSHANVRVPHRLERTLRGVVVTPELHRLHHSVDLAEQNTNFGSVFPWWDRVDRTYLAGPLHGPIVFGLREVAPGTRLTLTRLLRMPFSRDD